MVKLFQKLVGVLRGRQPLTALPHPFIKNQKITTIGDDKNDIGMIVEFDGYALESASEEVKNAAPDGHVVASVRNLIDSIL